MSERPPAVTRRAVLAAGATAATAGCGSLYPAREDPPAATDWPISGHDPRGSYQTPATGGPTAEPRVRWTTERGGALLVREPVVYDGSLYPGRFSDLRIDTEDGTTDRRGVAFRSPPAVVVASSYRDATLVGHRSSSGDGAFPGTPDTALVAFRRSSDRSPPLRRRWRYPRPPGSLRMWDTDSPATVVPVGDRIVVGGSFDIETEAGRNEFGGLAVVDANTGESVWTRPLGNDAGTAPAGRPSVVDGTVYAGTARRTVHALALDDGTVRWGRSVTDENTYAVPSVVRAGDTVIAVVGESVLGLDPSDGTTLWHRRFDRPVDRTDSRPTTVADGLLLLPVDGSETDPETLRALDVTTGETRWRVTVPRVEGVPVVADGVIYHSEYDAVAARDFGDGTLRWRHQPGTASALGTPVVDDTGLYVGGATAIYGLEDAA